MRMVGRLLPVLVARTLAFAAMLRPGRLLVVLVRASGTAALLDFRMSVPLGCPLNAGRDRLLGRASAFPLLVARMVFTSA